MKVVVDHVRGSRRGQRQVFASAERVSIGRHPECDVSFDAHRDLDASSRHAELRRRGDRFVLCDVGSSNGTLVAGERIDELELTPRQALLAEFGAGGPQLRLWVGGADEEPEAPPVSDDGSRWRRRIAALALVAAAALALLWWLAG